MRWRLPGPRRASAPRGIHARRRPGSATRDGFALTELLIVIAILAVLIGMLLPAVQIIREAAQQSRCASNMRQLGTYICLFADDNEGQMPGSGRKPGSSVSWLDIINAEVVAGEAPQVKNMNGRNRPLICPLFTALPNRRCYTYNFYASGGINDSVAGTSQYGSVVTPADSRGPSYTFYCLGAPMGRFSGKSAKILLRENERAADYCSASPAYGDLTLGDDPTFQSFCSHGGTFAFRHRGRVANFLFLDLHVEARGPDGSLNLVSAYDFN